MNGNSRVTKKELAEQNMKLAAENELLSKAFADAIIPTKPYDYETTAVMYPPDHSEESVTFNIKVGRMSAPFGGYVLIYTNFGDVRVRSLDDCIADLDSGVLLPAFRTAMYNAKEIRREMYDKEKKSSPVRCQKINLR